MASFKIVPNPLSPPYNSSNRSCHLHFITSILTIASLLQMLPVFRMPQWAIDALAEPSKSVGEGSTGVLRTVKSQRRKMSSIVTIELTMINDQMTAGNCEQLPHNWTTAPWRNHLLGCPKLPTICCQ